MNAMMSILISVMVIIFLIGKNVAANKKGPKVVLTEREQSQLNTAIKQFLLDGEKNKAIKHYRMVTGADLKSAYDFVLNVEAGGQNSKDALEYYGFDNDEENDRTEETKLLEIQTLLNKGEKIKAIRRYREIKGVGLAEAKNAIDKISHDEKKSN